MTVFRALGFNASLGEKEEKVPKVAKGTHSRRGPGGGGMFTDSMFFTLPKEAGCQSSNYENSFKTTTTLKVGLRFCRNKY